MFVRLLNYGVFRDNLDDAAPGDWIVWAADSLLFDERLVEKLDAIEGAIELVTIGGRPSVIGRSVWGSNADVVLAPIKALRAEALERYQIAPRDRAADIRAVFRVKKRTAQTEAELRPRAHEWAMFPQWLRHGNRITVVGMILSLIGLLLAGKGVDIGRLAGSLSNVETGSALVASLLVIVCLCLRVWRWQVLFAGVSPLSYGESFGVTLSGVAINNLLPARIGEFTRALMLRNLTGKSAGLALGVIVIERTLDILMTVVLIGLGAALLPSGAADWWLRVGAWISAILVLAVAIFMLFAGQVSSLLSLFGAPGKFAADLSNSLAEGLKVGIKPVRMIKVIMISIVAWCLLIGSYYYAARALPQIGGRLPEMWSLLYVGAINLGVAMPSAPGAIGTFEAISVYCLEAFGLGRTDAMSITLIEHAVQYLVSTLMGLVGLIYWMAIRNKK